MHYETFIKKAETLQVFNSEYNQEQLSEDKFISAMEEKLLLKEKLGRIPTILDNKRMYCPSLEKGENAAEFSLVSLVRFLSPGFLPGKKGWKSVGGFFSIKNLFFQLKKHDMEALKLLLSSNV